MRILRHILLLLLPPLLACCTTPAVDGTLDRAEELMETAPDSALALLRTVSLPSFAPSGSHARHALLLSQALDKNYIDVTSDSLILIAERHYEASSSPRPLMLSYFYHGQVLLNRGDYASSLILLTKSLDIAERLGDEFWQGRATEKISTIYEKCYHGADEVFFAGESLSHYTKSGILPHLNYAFLSMARAYYNNDDYDNALLMLAEAEKRAVEAADTMLLHLVYSYRASNYFHLSRYADAIDIYENKLGREWLDDSALGFLGMSYLSTGRPGEASQIVETTEGDEPTLGLLRYRLLKHRGDYEGALAQYESLFAMEDSVLSASLGQSFNQSIAELRRDEKEDSELELKNSRLTFLMVILLIGLIAATAGVWGFRAYRRQRRTIEKNLSVADNLREVLSVRETQLVTAWQNMKDVLASRYVVIDSILRSIYETSGAKRDKGRVSEEIDTLIYDLSKNRERIEHFENIVDRCHDNVMKRFHEEFPGLKDADYLLYLYTILGFSMSTLALLLGEGKIESVYNRKARLKAKISKLEEEKKNNFLSFM